MSVATHNEYFLSLHEEDGSYSNYREVKDNIDKSLKKEKGKLNLAANDGLRPQWQRFIFGAKVYIRSYFAAEWYGEVGGLIFHDENGSEYRALAASETNVDESIRKQISFGESEPLDEKFCLEKPLMVKAVNEFLTNGIKPKWLKYEFVK